VQAGQGWQGEIGGHWHCVGGQLTSQRLLFFLGVIGLILSILKFSKHFAGMSSRLALKTRVSLVPSTPRSILSRKAISKIANAMANLAKTQGLPIFKLSGAF